MASRKQLCMMSQQLIIKSKHVASHNLAIFDIIEMHLLTNMEDETMYEPYVMHIRAMMTQCAIEMARAMTCRESPWRSISQVDFHFGRARVEFDHIADQQLFESLECVRKLLTTANDVCLYIFSEHKKDEYTPWFRHLWKSAEYIHKILFDIDEIICIERGMLP